MAHPPFALWGRVLTDGTELPPSRVEVLDGRIERLEPGAAPRTGDVVVESGWIAPGLIDVQVNGAGGIDLTSDPAPATALERVARVLAAHGITAFCPTLVSSSRQTIEARLPAFRPRAIRGGATCLGTHVEGPFIDPDHRGVHDPRQLRQASRDEIAAWLEAGPPSIVTVAPERPGGLEAVQQLARAGVLVSLGHSGADAAAAQAGLAAGARFATHLFNAMPPLHHRQPGLVGALLASEARLGLIADGVHVHPLIVDLVVHRAGPERVVLVSDALAPAGAAPGPSVLGDQPILSDGRSVRRTDGTLAGSAMLLDGCLRNVRDWLPWLAPAEVIRMATGTPAAALDSHNRGRVAPGYAADLIVLDPDWSVRMTFVNGERV